jgi:hypothetical protein
VGPVILKDAIICGKEKYLSLKGNTGVKLLFCQRMIQNNIQRSEPEKYINTVNHTNGGECKGLS